MKTQDGSVIGGGSIKRGFTMLEACQYLGGISRQTMYKLLGEGHLTSYSLGVRRYFTKESLDELIDKRIGLFAEVDDMIENELAGEENE